MKYSNMLELVGNTPHVELRAVSPKNGVRILGKLEGFNPTGSVKFRAVLFMVQKAIESGRLRPGKTLIDASSGNTAIALAMIGSVLGYRVIVVVPQSVTEERKQLIEFYGATIVQSDGPTTRDSVLLVRQVIAADPEKYFYINQYENPDNALAHYETTGVEIIRDLPDIDAFVACAGSGGTLMGVEKRFREYNPRIRVIGVQPEGWQSEGLNLVDENYLPGQPIFEPTRLDGMRLVRCEEALKALQLLGRKEGIDTGLTGGAAVAAAIKIAGRMDQGNIVVILPDGVWKYLSLGIGSIDLDRNQTLPCKLRERLLPHTIG